MANSLGFFLVAGNVFKVLKDIFFSKSMCGCVVNISLASKLFKGLSGVGFLSQKR